VWLLDVFSLVAANGNAWAVASLPLIGTASPLRLSMPRSKWAFYILYSAHVAVLLFVKKCGF
jgi:TraX protein